MYAWEAEVSDEELAEVMPEEALGEVAAFVVATLWRSGRSFEVEEEVRWLRVYFRCLIVTAREGDEDAMWKLGKVKQVRRGQKEDEIRKLFDLS
jgi:hypothetical protein